ncbi:general odorant-binding protein 99b-like [Wyeomyia smithii]|uniref:general odorant-binding protein 99b-like n=1 Tax=Wyeomyia smithii TaxID=174621 RepID=UPI002467B684|nr:general odorant-binding protein 99b-like [Wyeomyia smithii]
MLRTIKFLTLLWFFGTAFDIPVEAGEILNHLINSCSQGLAVTEELAERYRRIDFPDDPTTKCVLRCMALTLGVYDDKNGIHMGNTWLMFRGERTSPADEKEFAEQHYRCIERNLNRVARRDYCGRVYGTYLCYREEFQALVHKMRRLSGLV